MKWRDYEFLFMADAMARSRERERAERESIERSRRTLRETMRALDELRDKMEQDKRRKHDEEISRRFQSRMAALGFPDELVPKYSYEADITYYLRAKARYAELAARRDEAEAIRRRDEEWAARDRAYEARQRAWEELDSLQSEYILLLESASGADGIAWARESMRRILISRGHTLSDGESADDWIRRRADEIKNL